MYRNIAENHIFPCREIFFVLFTNTVSCYTESGICNFKKKVVVKDFGKKFFIHNF
jgi:hypothetical protein